MHGYAIRSVAPASEALTIAHSLGHGTSTSFFVAASDASDTVKPSFTSDSACLRLAGVIRFNAPISSSFPHRPQFESSVCHRSNSAWVTTGRDVSGRGAGLWEKPTGLPSATATITVEATTIIVLMVMLLGECSGTAT